MDYYKTTIKMSQSQSELTYNGCLGTFILEVIEYSGIIS